MSKISKMLVEKGYEMSVVPKSILPMNQDTLIVDSFVYDLLEKNGGKTQFEESKNVFLVFSKLDVILPQSLPEKTIFLCTDKTKEELGL